MLDRDKNHLLGDATVSPVSSARKNILGLGKSSYNSITKRLKYHPYIPIRLHHLKPGDLLWRLQFCNCLTERSDEEMLDILISEEANFQLYGNVNSQSTHVVTMN